MSLRAVVCRHLRAGAPKGRGAFRCSSSGCERSALLPLSLYKILFRFKALLWESIILVLPPSTCKAYPIAILLHDHCAIYALPPTSLSYAIHHTILVMAISCKGQLAAGQVPLLIYAGTCGQRGAPGGAGGCRGRGKVPYCTSCATFPLSAGIEEKWHNWYSTQYGTSSLQNIGFILEGAHPIAAELKWHNWYSTALFLYRAAT